MTKVQADIGRQGIVVAAVVVILVAAIGYLGYGYWQSHSAKPSDIAAVRVGGRGVDSKESDHYQQTLKRYNDKNADQAHLDGKTYLSVPSTRAVVVKPEEAAASAPTAPPATVAPPQQQPPAATERAAYVQQNAEHSKLVDDQVHGMLMNWAASTPGIARVSKDAKEYVASMVPAQQTQVASGKPPTGEGPVEVIVPGYVLAAAELRTNIDTDESSVTEAVIPSGPYAGAHLFAPSYKRLGNAADFTFDAMAWRGRTYKVMAKPVDLTTGRTALKGEVNNRYFSRILVPAIAVGLTKAGQLYQQSGTQSAVSPFGGVTVTAPESPSGKAVAGTIVGGIAQQTGTVLNQDAAAEPIKQVTVPSDSVIGIRFLAPVLSTDEVTGGKMPASEAIDSAPRAPLSAAIRTQQQMLQAPQEGALQQQPYVTQGQPPVGYSSATVPIPGAVSQYSPLQ